MDLSPEAAGRPGAPRYAGIWIRLFANVLDVLWMAALNMALALIHGRQPAPQSGALIFAVIVTGFWIWQSATPGKMMCGLRIIDALTGGRPTAWQCVGRYLMVLIVGALAGIGFLWIAIDARKQGWHDKVVRTLVVHRGPAV
jgi:uncharacterized RDD family membrane protein YckC